MNVPKLRFKEFDGEWRRYNLSSIVNLLGGNAFSSADSVSEGIKWLKIANVGFGKVMWNNKDFLPYSFQSQYAKYLLEEEDIVLTLTRPILNGKLKIASLNKRDTPSLLNQRVAKIEVKNDITSKEFLFHLLQNRRTVLDIEKSISGTDPPNLGNKELKKIEVDIPFLEEGNKVAVFLNKLSEKIQLQQQKIDLLQEQKKGFLQKTFPKAGETQPEMRFKGFKNDWETIKAKDLFNPVVEKNRQELPVLSVTQDNGVVYRNDVGIDIKYDPNTLNNYKVIHPGDFVISLRSFQGGFELSDKLGICSPAYTIFVPKVTDKHDNSFWKTKFKTFNFIESLKTVTFGIRDGKSISFSEFGDLKLSFPNVQEQQKLGRFFEELDKRISMEGNKLTKLQKQKQGFMQQMFI